jgi:hypothetical protein
MKQTAVEWQFEQFFNSFEKFNNGECTFNDYFKRNLEIRKQTKEMEKEQMFKALIKGTDVHSAYDIELEFKEWYNETFKQQEQTEL